MSQDDDLSQFFFVLPLKNIPNSNTKVEWVWVLSPTPLLNSLQINHFAANTCYQSLAFCLVGTQALAQLHNHTCLLRSLLVLACTRLYCHKLPTISIHLFFFFLLSLSPSMHQIGYNPRLNLQSSIPAFGNPWVSPSPHKASNIQVMTKSVTLALPPLLHVSPASWTSP